MDKLRALYESYISKGLLSKETTFEQFSAADNSVIESLYAQGIEAKILSKSTDVNTFKSAWGSDVKKKKRLYHKIRILYRTVVLWIRDSHRQTLIV